MERGSMIAGFALFLFSCLAAIVILRQRDSIAIGTLLLMSCMISSIAAVSLSAISILLTRIGVKNRLEYDGYGWRIQGNRFVHFLSLAQRVSMLSFLPICLVVLYRWVSFGEAASFRWLIACAVLCTYTVILEHPFMEWRVIEPPIVILDPDGIEVRPLYGEPVRWEWCDGPVVSGFVSIRGLSVVKTAPHASGVDSVIMEAGAMTPSQLEALIIHFSQHPEDRSLLGSQKGKNLLTSLMKVPW
ncbi:hypothetical protein [Schaalia hyovaginalis]|uniref:hypothetical protein n=1 Tax=Schaalia hyovaginalis TaxID=29316 RepID=UPI002A7542EE|nr:hypothetical protein [Schaalia hyovaginalis]MDY2669275.1 hypothetical protein [Schaalia hyovaginalis]